MGVPEPPNRLPESGQSAAPAWLPAPGSRSIPIGALDAPWLRAQSKIAVGPLDVPSIADLRAAFVELAARGERTRLGYTLSPTARRWVFDPHRLEELAEQVVVELEDERPDSPDSDSDNPEVIYRRMEEMLASVSVANTTVVHLARAGRFLVFAQNHALGDAHLTFRLPSAVVQVASGGGVPPWVDAPHAAHPLWSAVLNTVQPGRNPFAGLWRERASAGRGRPGATPLPPSEADGLALRTAFRCLSRRSWQEVKAWRSEHAPEASLASLQLVILRQALASVGIAIAPETVVLYDCRRYLPGRDQVLGNFVVARSQRLGDDPNTVSTSLAQTLASGRPLATLVAATAKHAARPPRTQHTPEVAMDAECLPTFVFPPRSPELESLPWQHPDFRCMAVSSGPPRANAITATMHLLGGRLSTSLCYHPAVISEGPLYAAIALMEEHPIALLERSLSV